MNRRDFCSGLFACGSAGLLLGNLPFAPRCIAAPLQSKRLEGAQRFREVRYVMGTLLDITVYDERAPVVRSFFDQAFAKVKQLDALLSTFKADSEISRLNSLDKGQSLNVSDDTKAALKLGQQYAEQTAGRFDIGVRPLVDLWQRCAKAQRLPSSSELAAAKSIASSEQIVFKKNGSLSLKSADAAIETGGIGKGYAVGQVVSLVSKFGIESALINFGHSTIYAFGVPPGKDFWDLSLRFPGEPPQGTLSLRNTAASASASLGESQLIAGERFGHIVDPAVGEPLRRKRLVAVTTRTALEAEVLSTDLVLQSAAEATAVTSSSAGSQSIFSNSLKAARRLGGSAVTFKPSSDMSKNAIFVQA